jgi:hypothetical protein
MPDFNVRADSVNVEQIMEQIRARIRDKRGVDYTEEQIRELAAVKLEKFLDPRGIRSDLLEQFRKTQPPAPQVTLYPFEETTLFDSHRGIVRLFRRLFRPLLKLFFNSNALAQSLHQQTIINRQLVDRLNVLDQRGDLYYELLHNLVLELTRATIEVKNVTMRVESISSRLEFNERRARALESVVVYKPSEPEREARPVPAATGPASSTPRGGGFVPRESSRQAQPQASAQRSRTPPPPPAPASTAAAASTTPAAPAADPDLPAPADAAPSGEGPGQRSRRRRRRRGRRGGAPASALMTAPGSPASGEPSPNAETTTPSPAPDAPQSESRAGDAGGASEAVPYADKAEPPPPAEPREVAPLRPPSPAEPSGPESFPSSGAHDVDDL